MQLSPSTTDPDEARQWFEDFRAAGVEGLVAKGANTRYAPGRREWLKVKSWETTEVVAGGVIGTLEHPSQLVAGRYRDGELVVVGRTSPLSPAQSAELAAVLAPAGRDHPWPDRIGTGRFGGGRLSVPAHPGRARRSSSRSAPTPRCRPASSATRCATSGCARTSSPTTCRRSPERRSAARGDRGAPPHPLARPGRSRGVRRQRIVRPRRLSTRRSIGANTSSSIAMPTDEDQRDRRDDQRHLGQLAPQVEQLAEALAERRASR